jgi:putative tryptophan/tyrosine transport system substrate-binding protein
MPVVGFLNSQSSDTYENRLRGFRRGLKEVGYVEGENVAIEYRWADNQIDRLPQVAADLVRRRVAVIAATGGPASGFAAKAATTTIPIVFIVSEDPVKLGLVTSLARPGGNLTGINIFIGEFTAKRLEIMRELVPAAIRIAVLVNPANAAITETTLRDVEPAARAIGLQVQVLKASHQPRDRRGLRNDGRASRRAFRRTRPIFHQSEDPNCSIGGAPFDLCDICDA